MNVLNDFLNREQAITQPFAKVLLSGSSGNGKTSALGTLPAGKTLVLDAENGTLPIRNKGLDIVRVLTYEDVMEILQALVEFQDEGKYEYVCLDSVSEVAEKLLVECKKRNKDIRAAYLEMQEKMTALVRAFRDLEKRHVILTSKLDRVRDEETGITYYSASMPGQKLASSMPYFFDEVFIMRVKRDNEGNVKRAIQTGADEQYTAKDRSGVLNMFENNLNEIIEKIVKD